MEKPGWGHGARGTRSGMHSDYHEEGLGLSTACPSTDAVCGARRGLQVYTYAYTYTAYCCQLETDDVTHLLSVLGGLLVERRAVGRVLLRLMLACLRG